MPAKRKFKPGPHNRSTVRIIGGRFRGRRIPVPPAGVRPTSDRIRETLFNWLMPWVASARCLDMFAGTGALGLEALSRGAATAVFVDRDRRVADQLREILADLGCQDAKVLVADAERLVYGRLGDAPFTVERGERIAQVVLAPVNRLVWEQVKKLETTPRGEKGFGSTGTD